MQKNKEQVQSLLLAEACIRAGLLGEAMEEYPGAIPFDKFIACGDKCKAGKNYPDAFAAYRNANAAAKLIELGDMCAKGKAGSPNHKVALDCFLAAKATERLIKLGDKYTSGPFEELGRYDKGTNVTVGLAAYSAAGATAKLIELGDACFANGRDDLAFEAYKKAGVVEKLITIGDHFMSLQTDADNSNAIHGACNAYRAANAHDKLLLCADWYIQQGKKPENIHRMEYGLEIYREVGAELPMDMLNSILDHHVAEGRLDDAKRAAKWIAKGLVEQEAPEETVPSEETRDQASV